MKKQILTLMLIVAAFAASAQTSMNIAGAVDSKSGKNPVYLGLSTGINAPAGMLGLRLDAQVSEKVVLGVAAGLGSWGGKLSFNGYYKTASNWCPMIGIGRASGADSISVELEVVGNPNRQMVPLHLNPINFMNLGVQKQWFTNRGNRFFLELGYCLPLGNDQKFRVIDPVKFQLTRESSNAIAAISPGGLIVGLGFAFRL